MTFEPIENEIEVIANNVINCGLKVHRELGAGLLESVYEVCLESLGQNRGNRLTLI